MTVTIGATGPFFSPTPPPELSPAVSAFRLGYCIRNGTIPIRVSHRHNTRMQTHMWGPAAAADGGGGVGGEADETCATKIKDAIMYQRRNIKDACL